MIIRSTWKENYTVVPNHVFEAGLSAEATGVLCYLVGKSEGWKVSARCLGRHFGCGKDKMNRIMRELKEKRFAFERRGGKTAGSDWIVSDKPIVEKPDSRETRQSSFTPQPNKDKEPSKKKRPSTEPWSLPDGIDSDVWEEFEEHRREIRKPLTDRSRTKNANILSKLTSQQQRESVDATIANRWTGLFPPKQSKPKSESDYDKLMRSLEA